MGLWCLRALRPAGLAAVLLLAACGGPSPEPAGKAFVQQIGAQAGSARQGSWVPAAAPAQAAAAALASVGAKELFDWAEFRYPLFFSPAQTFVNVELTYEGVHYTVRSYDNGNHLGLTDDGRVWGLGPFTGGVLTQFGQLSDYVALVQADACRVYATLCFATGSSHVLTFTSVTPGTELLDSTSGVKLMLPDGGSGQVTMTQLTATPPAPAAGQGWRIGSSDSQRLEIVLEGAFDGSAAWPAVYRYETLTPGAVDDDQGRGPRWVPLPVRQLAPGRYAFEVSAGKPELWAADGRRQPLAASTSTVTRDYFIGQMAKASTDTDKRVAQQLLGKTYIDDVIAAMSPARAAAVRTHIAQKLPSWGSDGNYYRGFHFVLTRRLYPQINVSFDNQSLAHELGHYLTHMLVGDDAYELLEAQPYANQHGILDVVGRGSVNEDYAYFIESFLIGTGGRYDLGKASGTYLRGRPAGADVPSLEGFSAAMLAALVRSGTSIPSIDNKNVMVDVPVVGMTWAQAFDVVAAGARDVDALRRTIEAALDADGRQRLLVNLQRLGWRYAATLQVVDPAGLPVADAAAKLVVRTGGTEYTSDVGTTDAQGRLNLWFAFPGSSTLVLTRGGETLEAAIGIDSSRPTSERIELGTVTASPLETFGHVREVCASFSYTTITAQSAITAGPFTRVECVQMPSSVSLAWSGSAFSASSGDTQVSGVHDTAGARIGSLVAQRPATGSYKVTPPPLRITADGLLRDPKALVITFKLEGAAAAGHYSIHYQPDDDCLGGFCEARAVKAIDPASVSIWVKFWND
jgi:hypothetical protein